MRQQLRVAGRLLLAAALVWTQTVVPLPPREARAESDIAREQIRLFRAFDLVRRRLDRGDFDPAARARSFADWREAFLFVRDRIALLPYRGILRFADGTLASRAGNACDRALLLAELLRAMGREVRFARARLDEATVTELRRLIDRPRTAESRPLAVDAPDPVLEAAVVEAGLPADRWRRALAETRAQTAALLEAFARDLAETRAALARLFPLPQDTSIGTAGEQAARAALAEHCWVQLRTPEGWLDLDPTPGLQPGRTLAPAETIADAPDPALMPRLELRLLVHRRQGEGRESATVLATEVRPDAGLWTAQLAVIPEIRGPFLMERLAAGALGEGFEVYVPVLRAGGTRLVGEPFDSSGRVLATDFNERQTRQLGGTTGGLFGQAFGVLEQALGEGGGPREKAGAVFDGLELRLALRLPDGRVREARRLLVEPAPEDRLRRSMMLTAEIALGAARLPRARFLAETVESALAARPLWVAAVTGAPPLRTETVAQQLDAVSSDLLAFLQLRSAVGEYVMAELFPDLVAVPEGPTLVMRLTRLRADGEGLRLLRGFDLVFNGVRVMPRDPTAGGAGEAGAVRLLSTVDNVLEHELAGPATASGVALLRAAAREGVGLTVVDRPEGLAAFDHIPAYARGLIEEQLAAGRLVALPGGPLAGGRFGFWTLDPSTGAVHGFGADGTGQAAEYVKQIALVVGGSVVDCAVAALLAGGMDRRQFGRCVAIGVVVGSIVGSFVSRLATYAGFSSLTASALGDVSGSLAAEVYGSMLEAPPEPLRPASLVRALAPAPAPPEDTPRPAISVPRVGTAEVVGSSVGAPGSGTPGTVPSVRRAPGRASGSAQPPSTSAASSAGPSSAGGTPAAATTAGRTGTAPAGPGAAAGAKTTPAGGTGKRPAGAAGEESTAGTAGRGGTPKTSGRSLPPAEPSVAKPGTPSPLLGPAVRPRPARRAAPSHATGVVPGGGGPARPRLPAAPEGSSGTGEGGSASKRSPSPTAGGTSVAEETERKPAELGGVAPEGPVLATPTPEPAEAADTKIPRSMREIRPRPGDTPEEAAAKARFAQAVEAAEAMNLSWTDIGRLRSIAKASDAVIVAGGVDRHADRWYREGAVGKNIFTKGKSADRGAIAGLIPENQAYSRLYGKVEKARAKLRAARNEAEEAKAREQLAAAWKEIEDYNTKLREGVQEAGYTFVRFEVDGRPVSVYRRGNEIYQAYEKDGRLFDATTREPLTGAARDYAEVEPLRVVGVEETDPKTGEKRTRYVTAEIDFDAIIPGPKAPEEPVIRWKPKVDDRYGNRTPRVDAMPRGTRDVPEAPADRPGGSPGTEISDPELAGIPLQGFPRIAVFPDGGIRVLRNPRDVRKLYGDLKRAGWNVGFSPASAVRDLEDAGWIPGSARDDPGAVPPRWEEPPDAVKTRAPKEARRPRPRRRSPGRPRSPRLLHPRRRRSPCSASPLAA